MRSLPLIVLAALMACDKTNPTAPIEAEVAGTYQLLMVNGSEPPAIISNQPRTELRAGTVVLGLDRRYSVSLSVHVIPEDVAEYDTTLTETGTYTVANTGVYFTAASGTTRYTNAAAGNGVFRYTGDNRYTAKFISDKY